MIAIFPEIAASASSGNVEQLAILVRKYFGGRETFAPRPNVSTFVDGAGLSLRYLALSTCGTLLAKDERGAFSITLVVRQDLEGREARFLLAHLLGHYLLDVQPLIARGEMQASGYQEVESPLARYCSGSAPTTQGRADAAREARADAFAAALLLPRGMVTRAVEKLQDHAKVAAFFGVTRACLMRRLADLGLLQNDPVSFLDAEQRAGHVEAPAVDTAPAQLSAPDGSMPRAYAASSYGATEKATRQLPITAPQKSSQKIVQSRSPSPSAGLSPSQASASPQSSSPRPPSQQSQSQQLSSQQAASAQPSSSAPSAGKAPAEGGSPLRGMDRIRELARKLDKGVPPLG